MRLCSGILTARARLRASEKKKMLSPLPLHLSTNVFTKCVIAPGLFVSLRTSCCQSQLLDTAAVHGKSTVLRRATLRSAGCLFPSGLLSDPE